MHSWKKRLVAACVIAAIAQGSVSATAAAGPPEPNMLGPGYHELRLDGTYVVHAWGGAGGDPTDGGYLPGRHGHGGYVCWRGELNGDVTVDVGTAGIGGAGGASTVVTAPGVPDTHPSFDMTGYVAIAGGGGGGVRDNDYSGGAGGTHTRPVEPNIYGAWHGDDGAGTDDSVVGEGGGNGIGGRGVSHRSDGVDGVGGAGGDGYDPAGTSVPGRNSLGGVSGRGGDAELVSWKGRPTNGGGGGGFGGGGGSTSRLAQGQGTLYNGGGGGGGSYVGPSATPCTQADLDRAPMWDTRDGGRVVIHSEDTLFDSATGLEWTIETFSSASWFDAMAHTEAYGYDDWRLPTPDELWGLYPLTSPFEGWEPTGTHWQAAMYWTSESIAHDENFARVIDFANGTGPSWSKYPVSAPPIHGPLELSYRLVRSTPAADR